MKVIFDDAPDRLRAGYGVQSGNQLEIRLQVIVLGFTSFTEFNSQQTNYLLRIAQPTLRKQVGKSLHPEILQGRHLGHPKSFPTSLAAANRETGKRKAAELARRLEVARSHIRPCVLFDFLSACFRVNTVLMKRQTVITKKRRGPAPTGKGTLVGVRLQPDRLSAVDAWIARQTAPMTRPEAIRAMLDAVLVIVSNQRGEKPKAHKQAARASEMAAQTIERKLDPAVPEEERAQRRRRLTKGPPEFREDRVDLPKAKTK